MFKNKLLPLALAGVVVAVAAGAGVWYFVIRSDSPPPVTLSGAIDSLPTPSPENGGAASPGDAAAPPPPAADGDLAGTWTIVQGGNSFVGYRVDETLAGVGATTAVGRTSDVEGALEFDGSAITTVAITADLRTLTSDRSMRDGQLRRQALESDLYPTGTFVLTSPVVIEAVPADGTTVTQTVSGELTLREITRPIEVEVEGVIQDGLLVVVGSTVIQFADYEIAQPVAMSVLSVEDHGIMEFQLVFAKG